MAHNRNPIMNEEQPSGYPVKSNIDYLSLNLEINKGIYSPLFLLL